MRILPHSNPKAPWVGFTGPLGFLDAKNRMPAGVRALGLPHNFTWSKFY